jgi:hypothetical protein
MKRRIKDGPLAIALNASCDFFMFYESGVIDRAIIDASDCIIDHVNHAMTIVGVHYDARNDNDTNGGGDGSNGSDSSSSDGNGDNSSHDDGAANDDESEYVDPKIKCRKA